MRYWERNPEAALRFAEDLYAALELIAQNPRRSALYPGLPEHLGVRRFVLRDFPYVLPYLVVEDAVFVLAIAHTHRQPGYWIRRLPNPR